MKSQDNREYFEITFTVNGDLKSKQFFTETALDVICDAKAEFKKIEAERGLKIEYVDCIKLGDIYATEEKPTQPQEKTTMENQYFLNWVNQSLSVKTYREAKAEVTTLEDILDAMQYNSHEDLVASFEQTFNYDPELKIATFSGICASSEAGFEICLNQEAHNIESEEQGRGVWGLDDDLMPSI